MARRTISTRLLTGATPVPGFKGWSPTGTKSTRSSFSASRALSAASRWAMWIGSNDPPITPIRCGLRAAGCEFVAFDVICRLNLERSYICFGKAGLYRFYGLRGGGYTLGARDPELYSQAGGAVNDALQGYHGAGSRGDV